MIDTSLLPGRLLRRAGPPKKVEDFTGIEVHDPRLEEVLSADAEPAILYQFTLHGEGTIWDAPNDRLVWSDVPNRRLLAWYADGHVEVAIDNTQFMNGNALGADGVLVHCEHGRRCISRSDGRGGADPIITHFEGKRLNSPNDVTVAADSAIWFTDPTFGILTRSRTPDSSTTSAMSRTKPRKVSAMVERKRRPAPKRPDHGRRGPHRPRGPAP